MFALPLVNVHRVKSWLTRLIKLKDENQAITVSRNTFCAVCNETPIIPQETQCQHVFCYYCLKVKNHNIKNNILMYRDIITM